MTLRKSGSGCLCLDRAIYSAKMFYHGTQFRLINLAAQYIMESACAYKLIDCGAAYDKRQQSAKILKAQRVSDE